MIRFLAVILMLPTLSASTLTFTEADAALIIPDDWKIISKNDRLNATPPESLQDRYSSRRIHFTWASVNAKSFEDAIESEIDRITEKAPKQGSSSDRNHFIGTVPVKTQQGLFGLRADFAVKQSEEPLHYPIIKYYFNCPNGKILKVCAHVYGEKKLFDSFNSIILQGLTLNNTAEQGAAANP